MIKFKDKISKALGTLQNSLLPQPISGIISRVLGYFIIGILIQQPYSKNLIKHC